MSTPLFQITFDATIFAGIGYLYSKQMEISSHLTVGIVITSRLANSIFKLIVDKLSENYPERCVNYAATNFIVNAMTILALNHFNIIAQKGTLILSGLTLLNAYRIYAARDREPSLGEIYRAFS